MFQSSSKRPAFRSPQLEVLETRLTPTVRPTDWAYYETPAKALNLGVLRSDADVSLKLDGNADWIRFQTRDLGGSNDRVFVNAAQGGAFLQLEVFKANGQQVGIMAGQGVDYTRVGLQGLPAGVYFAKVTGTNGATGIRYKLHVDAPVVIPRQDDLFGSNDTKATARFVGVARNSTIIVDGKLPRQDEDWYSFRLAGAASASSRVLATAPLGWKVGWNLEVFDSQSRIVGVSSGASGTHGVSLAGKAPGTYFVHVFSDGGYGLPNYRWTLGHIREDANYLGPSYLGAPSPTPPQSLVVTPANSALPNARINSVVQGLLADGELSRQDWIGAGGIFDSVEADGKVTPSEFNCLKSIIANATLIDGSGATIGTGQYPMYSYVFNLAGKVINGNFANATYQNQPLGNLAPNSSAIQLAQLVDKWFLGLDRPDAGDNPYLQASANPLFGPNGPVLNDIVQGNIGDCYFLSSVGTILSKEIISGPDLIAVYNPTAGQNPNGLFIANGDGTYTVKFFYQSQSTGQLVPDYVTVDNYFPTTVSGADTKWEYANAFKTFSDPNIPLWVAVIEKAFAQETSSAVWADPSDKAAVKNAYSAINGTYLANQALMFLSGQSGYQNITKLSGLTFQEIVSAYTAGVGVVFGTLQNPVVDIATGSVANSHPLVGNHDYMMVGYDSITQTIRLRNPWGNFGTYAYGTYDSTNPPVNTTHTYLEIVATVPFLQTNFNGFYAVSPNLR